MGLILILFITGLIVFLICSSSAAEEQNKNDKELQGLIDERLTYLPFHFDQSYRYDNSKVIAIDRTKRKLIFYNYYNDPPYIAYDFKDISSVRVNEGGVSISHPPQNQVRGAIFNGTPGIIITGGSRRGNRKKVQRIELQISLKDSDTPVRTVTFFLTIIPVIARGEKYYGAKHKAQEWEQMLNSIIFDVHHPYSTFK